MTNSRNLISVWDTEGPNSFLLEEGLISSGWEVKSYVRRLVRSAFNVSYRKFIYQSELRDLDQESRWGIKKILTGVLFRLWLFVIFRKSQDYTVLFHFGQTGAKYINLVPGDHSVYIGFYGHDISVGLKKRRWRRKYKKLLKPNVIALVMCNEAKNRLVDFGWHPERIKVWNLPVNFGGLQPIRRSRTAQSSLRIVTSARFVDKKGYPTLFHTLRKFRELGFDFKLTIFGYGEGKKVIEALAIDNGIFEQIDWKTDLTGNEFIIAYNKALVESDIFVLLARTAENGDDEGGPPLSVIQAQYSGIPVVVTKYAGWEITIEDQVSGILVHDDIVNSTLEVLQRAVFDYEKLAAIGFEGSRRAGSEFDREKQISVLGRILLQP
jgi:colanic acid/amylovoran biosynthesis glycosyltransferase